MQDREFIALVVDRKQDQYSHSFQTLKIKDLPEEDVLIRVQYSSLNYKDGMAVLNRGKIVRQFPMVPGIDLAGTVVESKSGAFQPGDEVISVEAKSPIAAPRRSRCKPNIDIRFTTASDSAGTASRYAR